MLALLLGWSLLAPPPDSCAFPLHNRIYADSVLRATFLNPNSSTWLDCATTDQQAAFSSRAEAAQTVRFVSFPEVSFDPAKVNSFQFNRNLTCFLRSGQHNFYGFVLKNDQPLNAVMQAGKSRTNSGEIHYGGGINDAFEYVYPSYLAHPRSFGVWRAGGIGLYLYVDERGQGYVLMETEHGPRHEPCREWIRFEDYFAKYYEGGLASYKAAQQRQR